MNELQIFNNEEFGEIRTVEINGEPWFVGKDISDILGYAEVANMRKLLEDDEYMEINPQKPEFKGFVQNRSTFRLLLINESGLYQSIFNSTLEKAKRFRHWVTSEVLPDIRKHGIYATDNVINQILNNPDFGIELLNTLKQERAARVEAEKRNAILTHVNKTYTMTEIAKELNMKSANELNRILKDQGIQYKVNDTWVFYSKYSSLGYEEIKQEVLDSGKVIYHRRITQLGREFILQLLGGAS